MFTTISVPSTSTYPLGSFGNELINESLGIGALSPLRTLSGLLAWLICWSWSSNTLATWFKELTHWKRPWCWERLRVEGERGDRGWDSWMASSTNEHGFEQTGRDSEYREAWCATVYGVAKSPTQLSDWTTMNNSFYIEKKGSKQWVVFLKSPNSDPSGTSGPGN